MWRAEVMERLSAGRVMVKIPDLFRDSLIGPVQSAVDAQVTEQVVIADLNPDAKVRDWWVIGYATQIGRWGEAYAHTHPLGQVDGLVDALALKADKADIPASADLSNYATKTELTDGLATKANTTALSGYATTTALTNGLATKADTSALSNYATTTALSNGLAAKADTSALAGYATTSALNAKANLPGAWTTITSTYWTTDTAESRPLSIRATPFGIQLSGRVRMTSAVAMDLVVATLPTGFHPTFPMIINVPTMGPGSAYIATKYQFELQLNGTITAREAMSSGARLSFNETLIY